MKKMIQKLIGWYVDPIKSRCELLERQMNDMKTAFSQTQQHITGHQEQLNGHQEQLNGHQEQLNGHQEQLNGHQEQLNGYQEQLNSQREQLDGHQEQLNGYQEQIDSHQEQLNGHQEQLDGHQEQLDGHQKQLTRHQMLINQCILQAPNESSVNASEGKHSFAQSGEDMIISYVLHFLQKPISEVTYLDLGANHAKKLSNTYHFYQMGAKGVLLEANPELIHELEQVRSRDIILNRAVSFSQPEQEVSFYVLNGDGLSTIDYEEAQKACVQNPDLKITAIYQIKTIHIQEILETYFPHELTILSIDLEGIEEKILEQIDFDRYKPWIIVLENIPYRPTLSIDEREYKGCSLLEKCGYTEYAFTGINSIFLRRDVVEQFNLARMEELRGE